MINISVTEISKDKHHRFSSTIVDNVTRVVIETISNRKEHKPAKRWFCQRNGAGEDLLVVKGDKRPAVHSLLTQARVE